MATRSVSRSDLVGLSSVSFVRPQTLQIKITDTKPNTRLYPFYDGIPIGRHITDALVDTIGTRYVMTDAAGSWSGQFVIPDNTYATGARLIKFQDSKSYVAGTTVGSTVGSAFATFTANGTLETFQTTITNIEIFTNDIYVERPAPVERPIDPLAQTFFTHGITGGCFITGIDIYFASADADIPITMEIRETVNGYPGAQIVSKDATVSIPGSYFTPDKVSENASVATTFQFNKPVYLQENKTYCFVLIANSNAYHVFTSEMGKKSFETGQTIFEQPYIGTLFKSENNVTWSAEQNEDIKFTIYKAKFSTAPADVIYKAYASQVLIRGNNFSVVSGSSIVTLKTNFAHAFANADKLFMTVKDDFNSRGITKAGLTSETGFAVTVIDEYTVSFTANTVATSTGTLEFPGTIDRIDIDSGGTGYGLSDTIVTISNPTTGIAATAIAEVFEGKITSIAVTNTTGIYTSVPTVTVTGSGVGATLVAITESVITCIIPRQYQSVIPSLSYFEPPGTTLSTELSSTEYSTGVLNSTSVPKNVKQYLKQNNIVKTGHPAYTDESTKLVVTLESDNENVSPVINTGEIPKIFLQDYIIRPEESSINITAGSWAANVTTFTAASGHNKIAGDTVYITDCAPPEYDGIYTVLSVPDSNTMTVTDLFNPGTYISGGITIDSELTPSGGSSKSKYISKIIRVVTPSIGVKTFVEAVSTLRSSFDVYVKTSLSSSTVNHEEGFWYKLTCDVSRNRSASNTDALDYEFYNLTDLPLFDTYSIKIVLHSDVKYEFPRINNYRSILLST